MSKSDEIILGITDIEGYTHDNSIAILKKGKILFAASEERYSRIKHDGSFPDKTIKAALAYLKLKPSSIKTIAVGYPKRKVLSVLFNRHFFEIFMFTMNVLINRNIGILSDLVSLIKLLYFKYSKNSEKRSLNSKKIIYVDHHLSHSGSAYFTSGFRKSLSIVLDAFGSDSKGLIRSGAIFLCNDSEMDEVMSVPIYSSLGNFYSSVTYSLGFTPGDGEGKTMGLAAYGDPKKFYRELRRFAPTFEKGKWFPGEDWLASILSSMPKLAHIFRSTRFGILLENLKAQGRKEDVAAAAQKILEEELVRLVQYLTRKYPTYENICLSGGLFLNVKANKKIMEISGVKNVFVHPNAGDGGVALGAAFVATSPEYRKKIISRPLLNYGLGESFTDPQILKELKRFGNKVIYKNSNNITTYTVDLILKGKVIGWFQGRAEWGPRALGFRSVLADPKDIKVKDRINEVLKNREWFMPFAPSVLEEEGYKYFKNFVPSPFMTLTFDVIPSKVKLFPAALHIDKTARPNSVSKKNNSLYYLLLKNWLKKTGLPIILNTSFNKHGLPIVNCPKDAIEHLIMGAVDELLIGNYCVKRKFE